MLGNVRSRKNRRRIQLYCLLYGIESSRQSDTQLVVRRSFTSHSWSIKLYSTVHGDRVYLLVWSDVSLSVRVTDCKSELYVSVRESVRRSLI